MRESPLIRPVTTLAWVLLLSGFLGTILVSSSTAPTLQRTLLIAMLSSGSAFEALAAGLARRRPSLANSPAAIAVILGCLTAGALGPHFFDCFEQLTWWAALAFGGASLSGLAADQDARRFVGSALISVTVLTCLHGLAQRLYLYDLLRDETVIELVASEQSRPFLGSRRIRSTFGQANGFACFLVTLLPLVQLTLSGRARVVLTTLVIVTLLLTGSAGGGLVVLGVGAVLAGCRGKRVACGLFTVLWIGAMVVAATPASFGLELVTARLRQEYWSTAVEVTRETFPQGAGAALFHWASRPHADVASFSSHPHQALLALAAETGIVGLSVSAFLAWRFVRTWRRPVREGASATPITGRRLALPAAALAAMIAPAIHFADLSSPWAELSSVVLVGVALSTFSRWLEPRVDTARLPLACGLGVAAFSAHAMVDFDLYVPGALAAVVALAATWNPTPRKSAAVGWGFGAVLVPLCLAFLQGVAALNVAAAEALPAAGERTQPIVLDGDDLREMMDFAERPHACRIVVAHRFVGVFSAAGLTEDARRIAETWGPPFPRSNSRATSVDGR